MINRCVVCGHYDPNENEYVCSSCRRKSKLIYSTLKGKAFKLEAGILYIGIFTPEELAYISENII